MNTASTTAPQHRMHVLHWEVYSVEKRLPPYMQGIVKTLRDQGHTVSIRMNKYGSLRYTVDGQRERNALQTAKRFGLY
jgi:hypothetical protein